MYQYKTAKARSKGLDAVWSEVDLGNAQLNDLYTQYGKVILTLTHPGVSHDLFLDMDVARPLISPSMRPRTVRQWLTQIGDMALPTTSTPPSFRARTVRYADVWEAGYDVKPVDRKRAHDAQLPLGDKNDLLLSREDIDFREMWQYCMVSVNGLFHRVGGAEEGLYVVEGGRTGAIYRDNHLGILSWRDVGRLEYISIMPGMVYKTHPSQKYADYANVKVPISMAGKTPLLVLGGYLQVLDDTYTIINDHALRINMANLPFAERLFESQNRIHLDSLNLTPNPRNNTHFSLEELTADDTILAYLTLPQSFIVLVDTPHLFARRHYVEKTKLPGRFVAPMPFKQWPLFSALGRNFIYKPKPQWGKMVLACENAFDADYNFNTTHWHTNLSLDAKMYSAAPWDFARGYLMEIGRYR